jgi:molecular chaperone DnaJ
LEKEIEISRIEGGKMHAKIPAGWNLKENLKISGEGMPRLGVRGRGDLYIVLEVKTPKKLSAKAKKLLEDLEGEM